MRLVDPYTLRYQQPKDSIIFAASQLQGTQDHQEDYFLNFNDECFVITDGVGYIPNGQTAAKLAAETAIWGYKHIRQTRFYRQDKKLFMKRIFRSTNLTVWQKRRENGFEEGLATTLLVLMVGAKNFWLSNAGDSSAWLYKNETITKLTREDIDPLGKLTKFLGMKRLGLIPSFTSGQFDVDDVLLLTSDGVANYLLEKDMREHLAHCGTTNDSLIKATEAIVHAAQKNGSNENMTAMIVKRILNQ